MNYAIVGVPEFGGLVCSDSRVRFNTSEIGPRKFAWTLVSLHYRLSGNRQLSVRRDFHSSEKLKNTLTENRIEFSTLETRNNRGLVVETTFTFPCELAASLVFTASFETGELFLKMRNVERYGITEIMLAPEAISGASLDELTAFILGETSHIGLLLPRSPDKWPGSQRSSANL